MVRRIPWPGFIGASAYSRSKAFDPQTLINLYWEKGGSGARADGILLGTPGKPLFANVTANGCRALFTTGKGRLFGSFDNKIMEFFYNGTSVQRGTIASFSGSVRMVDSENELCIVDGIGGYILDLIDNTLVTITNPNFPNGTKTVSYADGAFLCPVPGTGFFRYSGVQDGLTWNMFDEASAEGFTDPLQAVVAVQGQLCALGSISTEFFTNTGDGVTPYASVAGSASAVGCLSPFTPVVIGTNIFFLGRSALGAPGLFVTNGYAVNSISTPAVDADIENWADQSTATALAYEQAGHTFYEVSSLAGGKSHVYDVTAQVWSVRQSREPVLGTMGRDIAEWHAFAFGKNLVGDYRNGNIYELSLSDFRENGEFIIRERTGGNLSSNGKRVFIVKFGLLAQMGVGAADNCSSDEDPQAMLQMSYDGGITWGVEQWRSLGRVGQYGLQAEWSRLGWGYNVVARVRVSAGVQVAIYGAWADVKVQA